jgi:hypothetical protein
VASLRGARRGAGVDEEARRPRSGGAGGRGAAP